MVYRKNSLTDVICQLRFPAILRIGTGDLADFQDRIRQEYPLYSTQQPGIKLPPELSDILGRLNLPLPPGQVAHRFSTKDSKRFISLAQDFLALTEHSYARWEQFRQEMEMAEEALRETYRPAFYSRIGLRYKNIISRSDLGLDEVAWKDLLQPHILAEVGAAELTSSIVGIETRSVVRTPEVAGGNVSLVHGLTRAPGTDEECYMIDADFSVEPGEGLNDTFAILNRFNRLAGNLIRWAITDELHRAMGPETI